MKNLLVLAMIVFSFQLILHAQFDQGSWELNFAGSLGSVKSSVEYSSSYYDYYNNSDSESQTYFQLGVIPAYYLIEGLSVEPEISILAIEKTEPSFLLIGNLAYTFKIESNRFYPFIRAGYGITNAFQFPVNGSLTRLSNSMDIGVLNLGAGLKTQLTESVLLRTEVNYRKFSYSEDGAMSSYSLDLSSVSLLFGFSVLL